MSSSFRSVPVALSLAFGCAPAKPVEPPPAQSPAVHVAPATDPTPEPDAEPESEPARPTLLELPKASGGMEVQAAYGVEIDASGNLYFAGRRVANDRELVRLVREAREGNPDLRVVIRADRSVTYGRVVTVLDLVKQAGVTQIAFAVDAAKP
jgi:biopolymer transport protein ExbD